MKRIIIFLFSSLSMAGYAQRINTDTINNRHTESTKSVKKMLVTPNEYFFNVQSGALIGCNDCNNGKDVTFSFVTTHGITLGKKARVGLSVGLDSYQNWQTIPIAAIASWDLVGNKNSNALFLQLSYGWAHPWFVRDGAYANYNSDPFSNQKGGRMFNPQIGYRLKYHDLKLAFLVGYKYQSISYSKIQYYYPWYSMMQQPGITQDVTQDMNRVQFMMSVGWK
ncbi:MAG: hypothetical protein JST43_03705 [Bacteroidetes bacterium]|nr:hypothetical protein [Bacteroidota bacterium]MBS1541051.1 hypothetical protein [Bacteroidota bacterium]